MYMYMSFLVVLNVFDVWYRSFCSADIIYCITLCMDVSNVNLETTLDYMTKYL